ncbi:glycine betaine ABC transporter substrate-binding protein [Salinisphaera sp.]|uniref:glycine betaine ABC transporter substrate-binding protein n=1 Tax=Salinisphaera sp. TaxID=1914330 RepID=UPI002D777393|nr:glycine betaine ABC transporter substrate-binding protein [Salinisphaera sp.]HET7314159.1 glycine betaine ABC transporter substrate-binding protein [Salinisphaera sp.]
MKFRMKSFVVAAMTGATIAVGGFGSAQAASGDKTITIGWTAWADAEFVTKLAKTLIEKRTDYNVELTMASIGVQYQGVAKGDLDAMLMAWLPDTHAAYWKKVKDQVKDLGPLYEGAQLGWVVPDYVPKDKLNSIADLKKDSVKAKLDGKIQGIDPGAGLMQLSKKAMKAYGLNDDYRLVSASGAAMTAALARAEDRKEWIVVTGWTPHWMFGKWDLRFLKDPKGTLGAGQHIDAVVRQGFVDDYPQVASLLHNMHIPLKQLQAAMYNARQTSYEKAISKFIEQHPDEVNSWFKNSG